MVRVKIDGFSEPGHAYGAAEAGADFVGMIFAPGRRQVTTEQALEIVKVVRECEKRPALVGVFVNEDAEHVNRVANDLQLDWVQLSGNESWEYCKDIMKPIIKVIHVAPSDTADRVDSVIKAGSMTSLQHGAICLLDTYSDKAYGGTGKMFDKELAKEVTRKHPVFIAGGLNPENVGGLVNDVRPWGVDVASGVEKTPGIKDHEKVRLFIQNAKTSARQDL